MEENLVHPNKVQLIKGPNADEINILKAYKKRWLILFMYMYVVCLNNLQWMEFSSITHLVAKYYNISMPTANWTSTIFLVMYPFAAFPGCYITHSKGLRAATCIGCITTSLGAAIKVMSIGNDLFWILLIGQAVIAFGQAFLISIPPRLAAVWFKASEVSTACSLGVFGFQIGVALSYVVPPSIVQNTNNIEEIGFQLKLMSWLFVGLMVPILIAVICYFPNQPYLPPSTAQLIQRQEKEQFDKKLFIRSIKVIFTVKSFIIQMIAYAINLGVYCTIGPFLTQFILEYFEGSDKDAGNMGFVMIISGMVGSVCFGFLLDRTHKYRNTATFLYFCEMFGVIFLMFALKYRIRSVAYISCAFFGIFSGGYMPAGFEVTTELTYPAEEATTSGIIIAASQIIASLLSLAVGSINENFGGFCSLGVLAGTLLLGLIVTMNVPNIMKRQEASRRNKVDFS